MVLCLLLVAQRSAMGDGAVASMNVDWNEQRTALLGDISEIHLIDAELATHDPRVPANRNRGRKLVRRAAIVKHTAIHRAIFVFAIDDSRVPFGVNYSPHGGMRERDGATIVDADGSVRVLIGDPAFSSVAWLGSTIAHEVEIHVNRQLFKDVYYPASDEQGQLIQEVEAYDHEIRNRDRFGLSHDELDSVRRRRAMSFRRMQWENRHRVEEGLYTKW